MAPLARAPRISWEALYRRLATDWRPGEHVTIVGPTGSGKSHIALCLLDLCRYRLVLATKRKDPLVSDLRRHGYVVVSDVNQIQWTMGEQKLPEPLQKRVVFWPTFPDKFTEEQRSKAQAALMRKALDWADKTGGWAVLVDETMWMAEQMRLERALNALWFQGRTQGLSVIACAQRPARIPRLAFSSASYLFIFQTADKRDLDNLREIAAGFPPGLIEGSVQQLDREAHEALFIDARRQEVARVIAPPR